MAEVGVFGAVGVHEVPPLTWLEDREFVSCVWVRVEERDKVDVWDGRSLGFSTEFGALVTQFDCCGIRFVELVFIAARGCRQWYCLISVGTCTFSTGSHMLSLSGYPSHFTRYCNCFHCP